MLRIIALVVGVNERLPMLMVAVKLRIRHMKKKRQSKTYMHACDQVSSKLIRTKSITFQTKTKTRLTIALGVRLQVAHLRATDENGERRALQFKQPVFVRATFSASPVACLEGLTKVSSMNACAVRF